MAAVDVPTDFLERQADRVREEVAPLFKERWLHEVAEKDAAEKLGRARLGTTVLEQTAAIFRELARISRDGIPNGDGIRSELAQQDGWLFEVIAGRPYRISRPAQLQALVVRAWPGNLDGRRDQLTARLAAYDGWALTASSKARAGVLTDFQSPWIQFRGQRIFSSARDAEPCPAAWRAALAGPAWPGVRVLAEVLAAYSDGGGGEPETIEQRAVMLLRQAMAARVRWEVSIVKLAETIGWEGTPKALAGRVEQLAWAAGIRLTRPLSPSGKPKREPGTGRAVLRLEARNAPMLTKGELAGRNAG
jgi:hypothetical protein